MPKLSEYQANRAAQDAAHDVRPLLRDGIIQIFSEDEPDYFNEHEPEPNYFNN